MTKEELKKELSRNIDILMYGQKTDFKSAKKEIGRLWHSETDNFKKIAEFIIDYLPKFDDIKSPENQAAFVSGLDIFFLVLADRYFDLLKDFTIKVIQHPNGSVRQAMVNTSFWLYVSLTDRIDPFDFRFKKNKNSNDVLNDEKIASEQYISFVKEIESLIEKYDDLNEEAEYIDQMKPSVNKSLQILWNKFTDSPCYLRLIEKLKPVPFEIFLKRKEIENELTKLLKNSNQFIDLEYIKYIIYNEDDNSDFHEIIRLFDDGKRSISDLDNILGTITDAWNYFPHRSLNNMCPQEMMEQFKNSY